MGFFGLFGASARAAGSVGLPSWGTTDVIFEDWFVCEGLTALLPGKLAGMHGCADASSAGS